MTAVNVIGAFPVVRPDGAVMVASDRLEETLRVAADFRTQGIVKRP